MLDAIIKVGKQPCKIKFRDTVLFRALSFEDVNNLLAANNKVSLVVIEETSKDDIDSIAELLDNNVITVIAHNKEEDTELREALLNINVKMALTNEDVYDIVDSTIGVYVGTQPKKEVVDTNIVEIVEDIEEDEDDEREEREEEDDFKELVDDTLVKKGNGLNDALESVERVIDAKEEEVHYTSKSIMSKEDFRLEEDTDEDDEEETVDMFNTENSLEDDELENLIAGVDLCTASSEELIALNKRVAELEKDLSYSLNQIKIIDKIKQSIEADRDDYKRKIDSVLLIEDVTEVVIGNLSTEGYELKIAGLQSEIEGYTARISDFGAVKIELEQVREELEEKVTIIHKLNEDIADIMNNDQLRVYEGRIEDEIKARKLVASLLVDVFDTYDKSITNKMSEIDKLMVDYKDIEVKYGDLNNKYSELLIKYQQVVDSNKEIIREKEEKEAELNNRISKLSLNVSDVTDKLSLTSIELVDANKTKVEAENKFKVADDELKQCKELLTSTQSVINSQSAEIAKYKESNVDGILGDNKVLEETKGMLASELGRYKKESSDYRNKITSMEANYTVLNEQNKALKSTAQALSKMTSLSAGIKLNCNYTGRALIIPVMGSGSFGVTTTAVSVARKLEGNVLLMDFDLTSPKLGDWVGKSPIIAELPDIASAMKKTCLGSLIDKGTDYFLDNKDISIRNHITKAKGAGKLDYFSGSYTKFDLHKLMSVDFSVVFNCLGNEYDHIVVDLGRVGSSELTSALIKMFNEISHKNIVVALHDSNDMRSLALRLTADSVSNSKTVWLLNMAENSRVDDIMKKRLNRSEFVIMNRYMAIYGKNKSFDQVPQLKDKLSELVDKITS